MKDNYYVVKTVKKINEEEAVEIREKRNLLREKGDEKDISDVFFRLF